MSLIETEHIMPQTLSANWRKNLGVDYNEIHSQYLHNIGNLTLTGYNQKMGNSDFEKKRSLQKFKF